VKVAFYAPLKPPGHPVPSGDRALARLFVEALRMGGHTVEIESSFRSREGAGDRARQQRLTRLGERLARRLVRRLHGRPPGERPEVWFTYHLYYKAPDFFGPVVSERLGIPYVVAEASHAPKRATGPWAEWHARVASAIGIAARVLVMNSDDAPGLRPLIGRGERMVPFAPFIDTAPYQLPDGRARRTPGGPISDSPGGSPPALLAVGMMRPGRKVECYRLLARVLGGMCDLDWRLQVVGGGESEAMVRAMFEPLRERTRFLGVLDRERLARVYSACDLFVWPALGEPLGVVFLEAQASGLPVVAGRTRGVVDLVRNGETGVLVPEGDVEGMRRALRTLIESPASRHRLAARARHHVLAHHDLPGAASRLDEVLTDVVRGERRMIER